MTTGYTFLTTISVLLLLIFTYKSYGQRIMMWYVHHRMKKLMQAGDVPISKEMMEQIEAYQKQTAQASTKHRIRNNRRATPGRVHQIVEYPSGSHKKIIHVR